jgi:hypothetical protein
MTHYTIEQSATASVLFDGDATDKQNALDLMAKDAGYTDYADLRHRFDDDIDEAYPVYEVPMRGASDLEHAEHAGLLINEAD